MLKHSKHGIDTGYNQCINCRSTMFDTAKKYMEEIGEEFSILVEVLGKRLMN